MAQEIEKATLELETLISSKNCAPILLRLAFHDAGTYDALSRTGGPNGSIKIPEEYNRDENKGIQIAVNLCEEVKQKFPTISYADLYQLAGIVAVKQTGGPSIDFIFGRKDSTEASPPNRLPIVQDKNVDHVRHLRDVFYRMGFSDQEIVALSGAHTLGRAHHERSKYEGTWTSKENVFDNSYFVELLKYDQNGRTPTEGRVMLPTDECLLDDKRFKKYVLRYSKDEKAFFDDYKKAHKKMSELGFKQFPKPYTKSTSKPILFGLIIVVISIFIAYNCEKLQVHKLSELVY